MTAYLPDKKDHQADVALSAHPLYVSIRPFIRSFVQQLRRASVPADLFDPHRALFRNSHECREALETVRQAIKVKRSEIAEIAKQAPKPLDRLAALGKELETLKADEQAAKAAMSILRTLGDTLVWFALGFDRVAITALGQGAPVGYLSSGRGLEAEVLELEALRANGTFAILNDLTNCLRHGDVTTVEIEAGWRAVNIAEVKAGRVLFDSSRQAKRLEDVVQLLQTGRHESLAKGGEELHIDRSPVRYRTYLRQLADLLRTARREGHAWCRPSPSVVVEAWNEAGDGRLTLDDFITRHTRMCDRVGWWEHGDDVQQFSAGKRRLRDRRGALPSLAPLPLLPLPIDDLVDVVVGRLDYATWINPALLERQFAQKGLRAEVTRGVGALDSFVWAERDSTRSTTPAHVREQMFIELMTPATLIGGMNWIISHVEAGNERPWSSLAYAEESIVWEGFN